MWYSTPARVVFRALNRASWTKQGLPILVNFHAPKSLRIILLVDGPTCNSALREIYFAIDHCDELKDHPDFGIDDLACRSIGKPGLITPSHRHAYEHTWSTFDHFPPESPTATDYRPRDAEFSEIAKLAFFEYRERERQFALGLTQEEIDYVFPDLADCNPPCLPAEAAGTHRFYLEFYWVLNGVKPCFLAEPPNRIWNRRHYEVFSPIVDKYGFEEYGFRLFLVPFWTETVQGQGFRWAWVFTDLLAPDWPCVRRCFFTERVLGVAEPEAEDEDGPMDMTVVDNFQVGRALGYPIAEDGYRFRNLIYYADPAEEEAIELASGGPLLCSCARQYCSCPRVCSMIAAWYLVSDAEFEHLRFVKEHFRMFHAAAAEVGVKMLLYTVRTCRVCPPPLQCHHPTRFHDDRRGPAACR
jgi:hypothetical protein